MKQDQLASRLRAPLKSVMSWELGRSYPSFKQAERLADILHVPFGYLFLPSPPEERIPLPDFRAVRNAEVSKPSAELIDVLNDVLVKQQWYREFLLEQGTEPLPFVGRFSVRDGSERVAESIRKTLQVENGVQQGCATWADFLRLIVRRAEAVGVLVMRSAIAAGDARRTLSVEEFRGFTISDPIAPLVFVNGKDWPTAQIFTMAHELVHVWIGASGISNENLKDPALLSRGDLERFCNETAAEILIPKSAFLEAWSKSRSVDDNIDIIARRFKVSRLVAVRRALDLRKISRKQYVECYEREERRFAGSLDKPRKGGHFFQNVLARNSERFTVTVVPCALEGQVLYRDASRLLNVRVPAIHRIAAYLAKRREAV